MQTVKIKLNYEIHTENKLTDYEKVNYLNKNLKCADNDKITITEVETED